MQVRHKLDTDPEMPKDFYGRKADRWRVIFSIADALGCGKKAREAAEIISGDYPDEDIRVILLDDIRRVFGMLADDRVTRELLLRSLLELDDGQWTAKPRNRARRRRPRAARRPAGTQLGNSERFAGRQLDQRRRPRGALPH